MSENPLHFGRDDQGYNAFAPEPAEVIYSATLVNGAADSITVPQTFAKYVVAFAIQAGTNVFVDFTGATAAAPAGGTFAATTSTMNPGARLIHSQDNEGNANTISLITNNATAEVFVEFYPSPLSAG